MYDVYEGIWTAVVELSLRIELYSLYTRTLHTSWIHISYLIVLQHGVAESRSNVKYKVLYAQISNFCENYVAFGV